MKNYRFSTMFFWKGLLAVAFALSLFALTPSLVSAQTTIVDSCIPDTGFQCTANDIGVTNFEVVHVIQDCYNAQQPGYMQVDIEVTLNSAQPDRYNIGFYMGMDSKDAITDDTTATCYRGWLPPPLRTTNLPLYTYDTGFFDSENNGDTCGELDQAKSAIIAMSEVWIACEDNDADGYMDVSICTSWDQQAANDCDDYSEAVPGNGAKCNCFYQQLPFTPTAIEGLTFSASSRALPVGLALSGLGLVVIGGVLLSVYLRRRAHA